ncbi:nucleotidyltransferase family protein [Mesorhizobium sp. B2-3-13]|uniref:nucleotidyltransferase family protein n=1 Tax=unclassified Mesorhizobium TaxID=325217 RepID=UPI001127ADD7|nr:MULTISPECIES: nucleotidyltransferase family protein [unclassified Mesorhizobium]TPL81522.1 nucleotidyltransferase family protein [Mesorhizobium sp. B2-3-13]TPL99875.1 nucleotidyltransferase family protein [Mesorhizobium sp. B2-3-11]
MALPESSYERLRATDCANEIAYVQACLRLYFAGTAASAGEVSPPGLSVAVVADIARLNKVGTFVLKALSRAPANDRPAELFQWLETYRRSTVSMNAACLMDSMAINEALLDRRIDFVFLKGPFQQHLLYDDHFMKPAGDVDILVSPAGFSKAREVLRSIGYEVSGKSRSVWWVRFLGEQHMVRGNGPKSSTVDLHYRLQQPGSPSPRDADGFLRRKRLVEISGAEVPFTSAADTLMLSCISVAKALFNREPCAGYVCDIRASASRLDEADQQRVLDAAVNQGLEDTLLFGLRAADVLLGGTGTLLSERAKPILSRIGNEDLLNMVIAPWLLSLRWPQRRTVLWELCGRAPVRYLAEVGWAASADISRRIFERPASP